MEDWHSCVAFEKTIRMAGYKGRGEKEWDDEKLHCGEIDLFVLWNLITNDVQSRRTPRRWQFYKKFWFWKLQASTVRKGKVKFSFEQTTKAQRGSGGIALLFLLPRR